MTRPRPLPAGALLTRDDWIARGMSTRRLTGPDLTRVYPRFHTPTAAPATLNALCHALQTSVLPGAAISHSTAAALFGWPLPWWWERGLGLLVESGRRAGGGLIVPSTAPSAVGAGDAELRPTAWRPPPLHCCVQPGGRHGAGPHVTVHRMRADLTVRWSGLLVCHPLEVLCQIAPMLDADDLVVIIDHLLGPGSLLPDVTPESLAGGLAERRGRRGVAAVRAALDEARCGVESPGETRTRLLLLRAGFPEPVMNHRVTDPDRAGRSRRIDLAYPGLLIGVEYQGDLHRTSRAAWRDDEARRDSLASVGWVLRYVTADDIERPARFLSALRRSFLAAGGAAPPAENWSGERGRELGRRCAPLRAAQ